MVLALSASPTHSVFYMNIWVCSDQWSVYQKIFPNCSHVEIVTSTIRWARMFTKLLVGICYTCAHLLFIYIFLLICANHYSHYTSLPHVLVAPSHCTQYHKTGLSYVLVISSHCTSEILTLFMCPSHPVIIHKPTSFMCLVTPSRYT